MSNVVQFSYDGQIRRFIIQFIRMVSNFQVEFGLDADGTRTLQTIPVYYGDPSRQASVILKQNSENMLNSVPAMAVYISGLQYDRDRLQNPYYEGTMRIREQGFNAMSQTYTGTQDGLYTVERIMPAPYKLTVKLDIWTSNTEQKHQIIEQIAPLFNPAMEIQSNDNYIDWTSLSAVLLTDVSYTNRSVPAGADESIDVASMTFELPIWITLPAKVKKMGVVAQIIANIHDSSGQLNPDIIYNQPSSQQRFTPMNYDLVYIGNTVTLYKNLTANSNGVPVQWKTIIDQYGQLTNAISQLRLVFDYPDGQHEIVGTVAYNPTDPTQLLFTAFPETLPANTLSSVTAIIDPFTVTVDSTILSPTVGTRYLILNPIGDPNSDSAIAWAGAAGTNLIANANDIIEWTGSYWTVAFDSVNNPSVQYVTNTNTSIQYRWSNGNWVKSFEGEYRAGDWSLVL